jgi:hypothetical protein
MNQYPALIEWGREEMIRCEQKKFTRRMTEKPLFRHVCP